MPRQPSPPVSILPTAVPLAALLAFLAAIPSALRAEVTEVDSAALERLVEAGATVVDVRREDEWRERGVLEGAHRLTFFDRRGGYDVEAWLAELAEIVEPGEPLVLICARGVRSKRIADFLDAKLGMRAVHNVTGGIERWREDGGEIVSWP